MSVRMNSRGHSLLVGGLMSLNVPTTPARESRWDGVY